MPKKVAYSRPNAYKKGFEKMQRDHKLMRDFAEAAAREQCQREKSIKAPEKDCSEVDGLSSPFWCLPCKARETLEKVNAPL